MMTRAQEVVKTLIRYEHLKEVKARWAIPRLRTRANPNRRLNFYCLSTGRVGTRFFSRVLDTATNAVVLHQPEPQLRKKVFEVTAVYDADREQFKALGVEDIPRLEEKVLRQLCLSAEVYGDTLNHMFPFGYMLYKYLGPEKLRLIHLVRHPRPCGRSILVSERDDDGYRPFSELRPPVFLRGDSPAEKTAAIWNGVNAMVAWQFELIDDPAVCRVVRLEDVSVELFRSLFEFLGMEGFDADAVQRLMADTSKEVRHSHVASNTDNRQASEEELDEIWERCGELAARFGYAEQP